MVSGISYFWLVDWPNDAKFLDEDERKMLLNRLSANSEGEARMDRVNWRRCFRDWKVWVG